MHLSAGKKYYSYIGNCSRPHGPALTTLHNNFSAAGILPTTFATSNSPGSLQNLINVVNKLRVSGGTTSIPEEALDGISRALNLKGANAAGFEGKPNYDVMKNGQIILMTDSQSQQKNLKDGIISTAKTLNTCINSFISPFTHRRVSHNPVADGIYEEISKKTGGEFVPPSEYSYFELGKFAAEHANSPCGSIKGGEEAKPVKGPGGYCTTVKVSALAKLLKLAMESTSTVTITDPKGAKTTANSVQGLAVFSKGM